MPVIIDGSTGVSTPYAEVTNGIFENAKLITTSYTITTDYNALSAGPITIDTGVTVTIPTGSVWAIV